MISRWYRNLSMTRRLVLVFLSVVAGILILVSVVVGILANRSLEQSYRSQLDATGLEKQSNLQTWFDDSGSLMQAIARDPELINGSNELLKSSGQPASLPGKNRMADQLKIWTGFSSRFLELEIVDRTTRTILLSTQSETEGSTLIPEMDRWPTSGVVLSPVIFTDNPPAVQMFMIAPIAGESAAGGVFLVGQLNLAEVSKIVTRRTANQSSDEAFLVTGERKVVVAPRLTLVLNPGREVDSQALRTCVQRQSGQVHAVDYRGIPAEINYRWLDNLQMCLVVKMDEAEIYAPSQEMIRSIALLAVGGLALALLVTSILARQVARPLNELVQGVEAFGLGRLDVRLPVDTTEEIGRLRTAFNHMAANLQHSLAQLNESQVRYKLLAEGALEGLVFSENGVILDCNPQFAWMFGYSPNEMIGMAFLDLAAPESRDRVEANLNRTFDRSYEFSGARKDGLLISVEASSHQTPYQGRWVLLTSVRDLTAQRQAQASEARLLSILEATPDFVSTATPEGNYLYLNRAARRSLGFGDNEDISRVTIRDVHPDWANKQLMETAIPAAIQKGFWMGESALLRPDGGEIQVSKLIIAHFSKDGGLEYLSTINRDISAQKRLEKELLSAKEGLERRVAERTQELEQKAKELARSNSELEQFAYIASHDLQEPLRMISSYLQLIERRYRGKLDADADDYIHYAVDGAHRLKTLINDLLAFSRVGTHGRPFEAVDLAALVEQVRQSLKFSIQEAGAEITVHDLPVVQGDPVQLGQLFQNLLANALKFHGEQPPRIQIRAVRRESEWWFTVEDNGIGIEPQYAERVFVIFQRLHTREQYPGTGIGLAVCKRIVERHGGRIWVESQPGQGSTFYFTLAA